ncbi:hypothetical protein D3C76_787920 [compost metagenome]
MIAPAPFGDIVEQGGNQNQLWVAEARPQLNAQRMFRTRLFFGETFQFQHHANGVFIHRVSMEQVKLHLADDVRPLRHVGPEHAVAVHRQQPTADRAGVAQHAQE